MAFRFNRIKECLINMRKNLRSMKEKIWTFKDQNLNTNYNYINYIFICISCLMGLVLKKNILKDNGI